MSFSGTYNLTTQFAAFPCAQPDPVIMAVTLVPAIAPALFDYAGLTCRDIIKARMGHQAPCGRALKGPLVKAIPPAWVNTATGLMKFEAAFSRIGNAFLIADLASDTVARWTTLAYQLERCPDALDGATWQITRGAPEFLLANVPTIVGGLIRHEKGHPGIAWGTGAIVPDGWHFTSEWTVSAISPFTGRSVSLKTWVQRQTPPTYDYPATFVPPGLFHSSTEAHNLFTVQNKGFHGTTVYTYYAMAGEDALTTDVTATCQATPFDQANWTLSPLSCFRDLTSQHIPNPAGRNRGGTAPTIVEKLVTSFFSGPQPKRGPPGGKPRSKGGK